MIASAKTRLPSAVSLITSCIRTVSLAAVSMVLRTKSVVLLPLSAAARSMIAFSSNARRSSSRLSRVVLAIALATSSTDFCPIVRLCAVQGKVAVDRPLPCGCLQRVAEGLTFRNPRWSACQLVSTRKPLLTGQPQSPRYVAC